MSRVERAFLVLAFVLAALAPLSARADEPDVERAREHFERGVALYEEGGFDAALVEFQQAYELAPSYRILFNLGQIYFQLHDYAEALRTFERYLEEGGDEIPAERRRAVERDVATLRERVGTLVLEVNVEGATVLLDDVAIGTTPLEPLVIDIGRHVLRVDAAGYRSDTRRITVASREEVELSIVLESGAGATPPDDARSDGGSGRAAALWALGATALLTGAGAGVAFGFAYDADTDLDAALGTFPADASTVESARDQLRASSLAADILGGVAIASAAAFVIVLAATSDDDGREAEQPEARLELRPGGLGVRGRF
ncbi:PEGA domain-containing protein [Sandaracinus amylolyticus]|uniref:PEGA domain-containing protein n=1 Tax=Sandaracinus amylolyticus TaxID=927083 RepID=UPI0012EE768C|nr:PEGA domain-containing protein [Sandaracinus amylolyticus]